MPESVPRYSVVMPCLNEAEAIGNCIDAAFESLERAGIHGEVVVADNGSTDDSREIARTRGATVVCAMTRGYGAALRAAVEASSGDIIIMGDSDGAHEWRDVPRFLEEIEKGYELVVGNRFNGRIRPGAMPWLNRYLGNPFFSWILNRFYRIPIKDIHCGMRAITRAAYRRINPTTNGMEFASEMLVKAARANVSMTEVSVTVHPPQRSREPHLRPFRDGWRHLRLLLSYAPNYLYIVPGMSLLAIGFLLQLALITGPIEIRGVELDIHLLALGSLMSLVGFSIGGLGVLAKVIAAQRDGISSGVISRWVQRHFKINTGIVTGLVLVLVGCLVNGIVFWDWLRSPGSPRDTVHLTFVMSTMIAMGLQLIFGSFLLDMLLDRSSSDRRGL